MSEFNLRIVTPSKLFFEDKVEGIIARTTEGELMVLANHLPFVANLVVSKASIKQNGSHRELTLAGGLLKVDKDQVTIISHAAEFADEIDLDRAERAKEKAEQALQKTSDDVEIKLLEHQLKKAINRINAKR